MMGNCCCAVAGAVMRPETAAPAATAWTTERRFRPACVGRTDSGCSAISPLLFSIAAIARIGRRAIRIPAALFLQIAHEVVQIGLVQRVSVGRHPGPAIANLVLDPVFTRGTSGKQGRPLEHALERRRALGELVMAEPAFVIEDFAASFRAAISGLLEFIDRFGALIGIALHDRRLAGGGFLWLGCGSCGSRRFLHRRAAADPDSYRQ